MVKTNARNAATENINASTIKAMAPIRAMTIPIPAASLLLDDMTVLLSRLGLSRLSMIGQRDQTMIQCAELIRRLDCDGQVFIESDCGAA